MNLSAFVPKNGRQLARLATTRAAEAHRALARGAHQRSVFGDIPFSDAKFDKAFDSALGGKVALRLTKGIETWAWAQVALHVLDHVTAGVETARADRGFTQYCAGKIPQDIQVGIKATVAQHLG